MKALPPTGPIQRAISVRPQRMEYDIINPSGQNAQKENSALRMSGYGKNLLAGKGTGIARSNSVAAGVKQVAKQGEANMTDIWP